MDSPYLPAITAIKAQIAEKESELAPLRQQLAAKEAEILPLKTMANGLLKLAGMPEEYKLDAQAPATAAQVQPASHVRIKPGQFFNKEPSEAAVEYLTMKKAAAHTMEPTPAEVDEIYAALLAGNCKFNGVSDATNKTALKTALTRNTAQVAKISDDLYGLRKWYGMRASRKKASGDGAADDKGNSTEPATPAAADSELPLAGPAKVP